MLEVVENARAAGVDRATIAKFQADAKMVAAADLALLSEVTAVAGSHLQRQPPGLKAVVASADFDVSAVPDILGMAQRAGVPREEIDAAHVAIDSSIHARLAQAKAVAEKLNTPKSIQDLASSIVVGRQLISNPEELAPYRLVFEAYLDREFGSSDVDFVEWAVDNADAIEAQVPGALRDWGASLRMLREAAAMQEEGIRALAGAEVTAPVPELHYPKGSGGAGSRVAERKCRLNLPALDLF